MRGIFAIALCLLITACSSEPPVALGSLERDRIAHTATASEVIVELPVAQGSQVSEGDVLVRLDDTWQQAQVARAKADLLAAEANLEKLRNGARIEEVAAARAQMEGAQAELIESQANYKRAVRLVEEKLASEASLDHHRAKRDAARAALTSASESLRKLTNGTRAEDLLMGEAQLSASRATLESETKKLKDLTIVATRSGRLDNLPWNLGERVTAGSPLAVVLAGRSPHARVYIPEPYRIHINIGDQLPVRVDGLEQEIIGTVKWISSEPAFTPYYALNQEERARLMYLAEVQLPDSAEQLANGVPAQVVLP